MPAITRPSVLAFFLRRLAATGNISLAAADAGLARSALHKRRARDPAFAASWEEALNMPRFVRSAGLRLNGRGSETRCWEATRSSEGAAASLAASYLTAPGDLVLLPGHGKRRAQVRRSPGHRLTPAGISAFLAMLERTANIRLAARHVGVAASSIHRRRRLDGAFAEAIEKALNLATMDIEADLLFQMNDALSPQAIEAAAPAGMLVERPHSIDQAIWLLKVHRDHACRRPRKPWSAVGVEAQARIWDSIRRKIAVIKQARRKGKR